MVYTACGKTIYAWRRGSELKHTYLGHQHPVQLLLPFGPHLLSVDSESFLKVGYCQKNLYYEVEHTRPSIYNLCVPAQKWHLTSFNLYTKTSKKCWNCDFFNYIEKIFTQTTLLSVLHWNSSTINLRSICETSYIKAFYAESWVYTQASIYSFCTRCNRNLSVSQYLPTLIAWNGPWPEHRKCLLFTIHL